MNGNNQNLMKYWPILIVVASFIGTSAVNAYQVEETKKQVKKNSESVASIPFMEDDIREIKRDIKDMQNVQTTQTAIMARIEAKL